MAKLNFQHSLHSHNPSEMFVVSLFVGVKYIQSQNIKCHRLIFAGSSGQWFSPVGSVLKNNGLSRPGILI